jgi:hypothetical protein
MEQAHEELRLSRGTASTALCLAKILSGPEINSLHTFLSRGI